MCGESAHFDILPDVGRKLFGESDTTLPLPADDTINHSL